jgi:hypothetical protein
MSREKLDAILTEIRALRDQTLAEFNDLTEADFLLPTTDARWSDLRRALLRFGDHVREHANQIEGIRAQTDRLPTMPQRMLAEGEHAWGKLLAATVGLTDDDLDREPPEGWTILRTLDHIRQTETYYRDLIRAAKAEDERVPPQ